MSVTCECGYECKNERGLSIHRPSAKHKSRMLALEYQEEHGSYWVKAFPTTSKALARSGFISRIEVESRSIRRGRADALMIRKWVKDLSELRAARHEEHWAIHALFYHLTRNSDFQRMLEAVNFAPQKDFLQNVYDRTIGFARELRESDPDWPNERHEEFMNDLISKVSREIMVGRI